MSRAPDTITLRHPTEADQRGVAEIVDEWFGGRHVSHLAGRSWFRHAGSTSWLALDEDARLAAFVLGFISQDRPDEAVIHLLAVDPNRRRRGIGRRLVDAFEEEVAGRGATSLTALAWPGEPPTIAFFRALGFEARTGAGTENRYGTPAVPDHEGPGQDRIVFRRGVAGG
jgi:ribosomal protein S18 acetylase RimI-like enzyme